MRFFSALLFPGLLLFAAVAHSGLHHTVANDYQDLVNAEQAFAAYGRDHSVKDAFAKFLSEAYIFRQGKFVLGGPFYAAQPERPGRLTWRPAYARVAASGNWGYTTGPSEHYAAAATGTPVGFGDFVSIWQKTPAGVWRVFFDGGTTHPAPTKPAPEISSSGPTTSQPTAPTDTAEARSSLRQVEAAFAKRALSSLRQAYAPVLPASTELRLLREGAETYVGTAAKTLANASTQAVSFRPFHTEVAPSGELGYTMGYLDFKQQHAHYLRIWRRQGPQWVLELELLAAELR